MTSSVLVIAAHPDDEALGCAGTIARHVDEGDTVRVVFLTDGVSARSDLASAVEHVQVRKEAAGIALSEIGVEDAVYGDFPDNQLDSVPLLHVVKFIETAASTAQPSIVYTHHSGDLNIDHRICNQAVLTAFRPQPAQSVLAIYGFETNSSTEWGFGQTNNFIPNRFVDVTPYRKQKTKALLAYQLEMRAWPHARSPEAIDALLKWRGAIVGVEAAEAFTVIREIKK